MHTFQDIVAILSQFWAKKGCVVVNPYDLEKGAGTSNPATFLQALGPEPYNAAYIEPCRRPKDGRYGENPNRLQHYFQYQVILKPSPDNILDLYLESLHAIGLDVCQHDIRFVHDDWENPTLGAWGLGWEIWIDGMEMTQFTYFQAVGGIALHPITGEITYGIERLAMCLQGVNSIFDIQWNEYLTYGDIYKAREIEWSSYNFEAQNDRMWAQHFLDFQKEALSLIDHNLPCAAYDFVIKSSHAFNMLDAKGVISVTQRANYIATIRDSAKRCAETYLEKRRKSGFPLLNKMPAVGVLAKQDVLQQQQKPHNLVSSHQTRKQEKKIADFLLEIGVEELPATFVSIGIQNVEKLAKQLFEKYRLSYTSLQVYGSPRRIALIVTDLETKTKEEIAEKKGPLCSLAWQNGKLTPIGKGFLTSLGLVDSAEYSLSDVQAGKYEGLFVRVIKENHYLFFTYKKASIDTNLVLMQELAHLIRSIEFPKSMKWGAYSLLFARPIRWLAALFGDTTLPFFLDHIQASNITYGNRQLTQSHSYKIDCPANYLSLLQEKAHVIVDHREREKIIRSALQNIAEKYDAQVLELDKVMQQVVHLVEKPFIDVLSFDSTFLEAPSEILVSEMVEHQKYFPLHSLHSNTLLPFFVIVANRAVNECIKLGNQKVLSARLCDGTFLWKEDVKTPLNMMREKLRTVGYQANSGSMFDKTERVTAVAASIAQHTPLFSAISETALTLAATLSKADLTSHVVGEFPELQGIVGMHIARAQKEIPAEVAIALQEHWLPTQEGGALPSTHLGSCVALADKLDSLSIFFLLNIKPTSSSDPYALRRAALGIVRIIIENQIRTSIQQLISYSVDRAQQHITAIIKTDIPKIKKEIYSFILTRAKAYAHDRGYSKECVETIFICDTENTHLVSSVTDDIYDSFCRIKALSSFKNSHERMKGFVEVMKRCIGQIDSQKVKNCVITDAITPIEPSEKVLLGAIQHVALSFSQAEKSQNWEQALQELLHLQKPIDDLFTQVKVLSDNIEERTLRLNLLACALHIMNQFGDMRRFIGLK